MKKNSILVIILFLSAWSNAQFTTNIPLPEEIRQGKLDNGMHYFILKNDTPKGKVSFYFSQNVSAILEEDHEDGLAHFLEHMAFNGSTNFPESNGMDKFLESKGFVLGEHYNASTDWNETLYYVNKVPTDDVALMDKIMLMMHDWSGSILLNKKDVDEERGVIAGEWREMQSPSLNLQKKTWPAIFNNTRYAERDVMGEVDFIQSFELSALKEFYKKWYRPDLQSVIIVGDIDVDAMKEKVEALFSKIPIAPNPIKRPYFEIPENKETTYLLATEKSDEIIDTNISIMIREKLPAVKDETLLRTRLVQRLFFRMLNKRFQQVLAVAKSPAKRIRASHSSLVNRDGVNQISITPRKGQELHSIHTAFKELERVNQYGFLDSELQLAKDNSTVMYESRIERDKDKSNAIWAQQLVNYYIAAEPVVTAKWNLNFLKKTLPTITLEELNGYADKFKNLSKSTIVVSGPEDDTIDYPSKEEILSKIDKARTAPIEKYVDNLDAINKKPLLSVNLPLYKTKGEFTIEGIANAKGHILNNGVRVVLMPSKDKGNTILLHAVSPGGYEILKDEDVIFHDAAIELVRNSGLGDFSATELSQKLASQTALVNLSYREYYDLIQGRTQLNDFENLLKLIYLNFEEPRFDKTIFETKKEDWKDDFEQYYVNIDKKELYNAVILLQGNGHPRYMPNEVKDFDAIDFENCKAIFKERFSDADDFSFVFTGNFDHKEVLPLLQKYLGNLSTKPTYEGFKDHNIQPVKGVSVRALEKEMTIPKTSISYSLSNTNVDYSATNLLKTQLIEAMLYNRFLALLREDEGGTYGAQVRLTLSDIPRNTFDLSIELDCDPDKRDTMLKIIKEQIKGLTNDVSFMRDFENAKTYLLDARKSDLESDFFWQDEITNALLFKRKHFSFTEYKQLIDAITLEDLQAFTKKYIMPSDVIIATLNPMDKKLGVEGADKGK